MKNSIYLVIIIGVISIGFASFFAGQQYQEFKHSLDLYRKYEDCITKSGKTRFEGCAECQYILYTKSN